MLQTYQSEIRDSTVRDLMARVKRQDYGIYLRKIKLNNARAFKD